MAASPLEQPAQSVFVAASPDSATAMTAPVVSRAISQGSVQTDQPQAASKMEAYLQEAEVEGDMTFADFREYSKNANASDFQAAQMCLTASLLTKLRQTEKAAHFAERRQDADASLPSELDRHIAGYRQSMTTAVLAGEPAKVQQIRKQWRQDRRDATWRGFQTGCCCGLARAARLWSIRL